MYSNEISYTTYKGEVLNLDKIQVYYEDTDPNSAIFGVSGIPSSFSTGKHAFFLNPSEDFVMNKITGELNRLKNTTVVKAEIIDKVGNRVYFDYPWRPPTFQTIDGIRSPVSDEFIYGYRGPNQNETGLALALEITDEIQNGTGTIILVGELENVPPQWKGVYNARWKKQITIDKTSLNQSRLYFFNQPTVDVTEVVKNYTIHTLSSPTTSSIVSASTATYWEETTPPPIGVGS